MRVRVSLNLGVNKLVRSFVLLDLALFAGWGFIEPIFSVFIIKEIAGATVITAGTAAALYWGVKSILQIPIANYLDTHRGEADDIRALMIGLLAASLSAFAFIFVHEIWQLYVAQVIHALALGLYVPSWAAIFSRHLDPDRIAFDWSLDSTAVGVSAGITAFLGAVVADAFGFRAVFALTSLFSLAAFVILLFAPNISLPAPTVPGAEGMKKRSPHFAK